MPAGHQAAFDRVVTLVASTTSLAADSSGVTTFARYPSRLELADEASLGIHRRYHVIFETAEPFDGTGGRFTGTLTDDYITVEVQVAYYEGGGNVMTTGGEQHGVDRTAVDDLNRLRQHVEHPDNYDQANTGIQLVRWRGTRRISSPTGMRIYASKFQLWIEQARLT